MLNIWLLLVVVAAVELVQVLKLAVAVELVVIVLHLDFL
jgi:hypothetical protein